MTESITIALVGNPNSGKTTIFNALTGQHQRATNYPGVTVEIKEGSFTHDKTRIHVVDLPGTYSLDTTSPDALLARDFIVEKKPDVVIQIIDAAHFERHAFLTAQLLELGANLVLVLNMADRARSLGQEIDLEMIKERLCCEVVETVGSKGKGIGDLKHAILSASKRAACRIEIDYGEDFGEHILEIEEALRVADQGKLALYPRRWISIKLLEGDFKAKDLLINRLGKVAEPIISRAKELASRIEGHHGDSMSVLLAQRRYGFAAGLFREVVKQEPIDRVHISDRIDDIVTHRLLGIPLFLGVMYLVFYATFMLGAIPMGWIETGIGWLAEAIRLNWPGEGPLKSLVIDGAIAGVGNVLVFIPNIAMLFLCISIIEDTGYMSRIAFISDRFMHKIGLHGKSVIPMIIGFGCSVPAIMATRTIENRRDRIATMMVIPLMSCGARLPIYTLFIPAFFPEKWRATMLWSIYLTGVVLALILVRLIRSTLIKGESIPFVMELPPYRLPVIKGLIIHVWERTKLYLRKAGTIILGLSIVMWLITSYPKPKTYEVDEKIAASALIPQEIVERAKASEDISYSVAGRIGKALEPVTKPLGFDWRLNTALLGGLAAKEIVVAQLGIIFSLGKAASDSSPLRLILAKNYTPLVGLCVMLFCLISAPCMATLAVMRRESGRWFYALGQFIGLTIIAYFVCLTIYQVGMLFL
ncbi:MAG: ferrous iron transport protein B [Pseudomonadota bacterium]